MQTIQRVVCPACGSTDVRCLSSTRETAEGSRLRYYECRVCCANDEDAVDEDGTPLEMEFTRFKVRVETPCQAERATRQVGPDDGPNGPDEDKKEPAAKG